MKLERRKIIHLCKACCIITSAFLLGPRQAQSEIIFDNLYDPEVGLTAGANGWTAQSFLSGPNPMTLDSVDTQLLPHVGSGTFLTRLYSNTPSNQPGIAIETLSGPSNPGFGTFH